MSNKTTVMVFGYSMATASLEILLLLLLLQ